MPCSSRARLVLGLALAFLVLLGSCSVEKNVGRARKLVDRDQPEAALRILDRDLAKLSTPASLSAAYLVQGDALARLGRVREAFEAYQKARDAKPDAIEPQRKIAELLIATGSGERALVFTAELTASHPLDAQILELHGAALAASGDIKGAESVYRKAVAVSPAAARLAVSLAEILLRQGRDDEAREVLLKSTESSKSPDAWLALGRLDEQQGNPVGAEVAYRRAVQVADTSETNLRLARFLQRAAKINEAQAVLKHVDELDRNAFAGDDLSFVLGRVTSALEGYVRALTGGASGRPKDTAPVVSRAIEAALYAAGDPRMCVENARVLLAQNEAHLDEGTRAILETEIALRGRDLPMAVAASYRALVYQPRSAAAHYLRGVVLDMQNKENAEEEWQEAVRLGDHVPSRMLLARVALQRGDFETAQDHIATVLREEPANVEALLIYARVLEQSKDLDAAESVIRRALIIDPASVEANVIAGHIAMRRNAHAAAFVAYEKALLFDRRSAEGMAGLLTVFSQRKPTRASVAKIERMASAPPASAMLYEIAGRLYEAAGLRDDANRALRRSLELDAHRPTAELALWLVGGREVPAEAQKPVDESIPRAEQMATEDRSGVAANNLAFAYADRGERLGRALELSLDAVRRMPSQPEPMDTLGYVLLKMRQYTSASEAFERALQLSPEPGAKRQILLHLADAYQASGEEQKAAAARSAAQRLRG